MLQSHLYNSEVTYELILDVSGENLCDGIDESREAIEFSIRSDASLDGRWIPLRLSYYDDSVATTTSGSTTVVRGYEVPVQFGQDASSTSSVTICGDRLFANANEVQFRWMGTANVESDNTYRSDVWALASVNAVLITRPNETITLIQDTFGGNTPE